MKKKKDIKMEDFIKEKHDEYKKKLGLVLWTHELLICDEEAKKGVAAEISQQQSYLSYVITFYPSFKKEFDKKDYAWCERVIVHELCHVMTEPLYDIAINHCPPAENSHVKRERERLTEILSKFVCQN